MSITLDREEVPALPAAREPAEVRGAGRDDVRLLVARRGSGRIDHARFAELPELLDPGDLLVVNTSATLPAAIPVVGSDPALRLHLSSPIPGDDRGAWLVELRRDGRRFAGGSRGLVLRLPAGGAVVLLEPHGGGRLWRAALRLPTPVLHYLARHGEPIRYGHTPTDWPLARYQTVYATDPGSAEMPSAGRAFTPELVTCLVAAGIDIAPLVLHTGVSSLEEGEAPHAEWYGVPRFTAERIELVRRMGGRVIAVGTTVVRALESAAAAGPAAEGWTDLVIAPDTPVESLDGLLTGFHDSDSSHLAMLEAIAGRDLLERSYAEAAGAGYLRHEFGDLHLILP
ncbi:MAG TPA: S-adenosylmethionine:tRNA ribosyltransferase-isomerase [Thermoleophilaceae bacterium]|nr:S-adenosylmethionine:tRNA ribosyltransferase-isomerase [Thermoleophilaceae bacterium]